MILKIVAAATLDMICLCFAFSVLLHLGSIIGLVSTPIGGTVIWLATICTIADAVSAAIALKTGVPADSIRNNSIL